MTGSTDEFIRVFEQVFAEVNRRAGSPTSHSFEIERACSRDGAVNKNRALLIYMRDIRNALQHPKHGSTGHAVQVTDAFLKEAKSLLNHLINPPTSRSVGVPLKDIRSASNTDKLGELADEMKTKGYSHVPILDERNVVIGVFNEAAVFDYLWSEDEKIIGRKMPISEILAHCSLEAQHTETFGFVNPRRTIEDLVEMFLAISSPTTRIGAIFVTASGNPSEPLQRMITPWDVLEGQVD